MITVKLIDNAKNIQPDTGIDFTHYVITVINEKENIKMTSGLMQKDLNLPFVVTDVPSGTWYATGKTYIEQNGKYIEHSFGKSSPLIIPPKGREIIVISPELIDAYSGEINIQIEFISSSNKIYIPIHELWCTYQITGLEENQGYFFETPVPIKTTLIYCDQYSSRYVFSFTIPDKTLNQGSYRIDVRAFNDSKEETSSVIFTGSAKMNLINSLPSSGDINLGCIKNGSVESIQISYNEEIIEEKLYIKTGQTFFLNAICFPENTSQKEVSWAIDERDKLITCEEDESHTKIKCTALSPGQVKIEAHSLYNDVKKEITLIIENDPATLLEPTHIRINSLPSKKLRTGETMEISATLYDSYNNVVHNPTGKIEWSSSDNSIIEIQHNMLNSQDSIIKAVGCGGAKITASYKDENGDFILISSITITVINSTQDKEDR